MTYLNFGLKKHKYSDVNYLFNGQKSEGFQLGLDLIIILFLVGFIGSFISGMLGIGGSIIKYPMLLYIPVIVGVGSYTASEVAGISAIQVFFATITGVWAYRGSGYLHKKLIIVMGTSVLIGSFVGGFGSDLLSNQAINIVYGVLATIAAIMMFVPKKEVAFTNSNDVQFNVLIAIISSFIVGIGSGIVGAAGAFLLVPIMLVILKIPTRITVASSLAITFISSIGSSLGKVLTDQVLYGPAIIMVIASIIASPLGVAVGKKTNIKLLQWILAAMIVATAVNIWIDNFS